MMGLRDAIRPAGTLVAATLLSVGCASFTDPAPSFTDPATLTPAIATVIPPYGQAGAPSLESAPSTQPEDATADGETDPCAPPELPVVAVCLDEPVGLAPLPDGMSALVGERTTGRVLLVAPQREPEVVAVIEDAAAGALRYLALSPSFAEDQLVYASVTTAEDDRVLRFPLGGEPTAVITGLPRSADAVGLGTGTGDSGGILTFDAAGTLLVTTADGRVLRFDGSGTPDTGDPVVARGLVAPTGSCPLPEDRIGIIDHRPGGDALIILGSRTDFAELDSGDALWTFSPGAGGAIDCAISDGALLASSRQNPAVTRIEMRDAVSFTGVPEQVADGDYGYFGTVVTGPGDIVWVATRNRTADNDLDGFPTASDDRVIMLPPSGGGGDGGTD